MEWGNRKGEQIRPYIEETAYQFCPVMLRLKFLIVNYKLEPFSVRCWLYFFITGHKSAQYPVFIQRLISL